MTPTPFGPDPRTVDCRPFLVCSRGGGADEDELREDWFWSENESGRSGKSNGSSSSTGGRMTRGGNMV